MGSINMCSLINEYIRSRLKPVVLRLVNMIHLKIFYRNLLNTKVLLNT